LDVTAFADTRCLAAPSAQIEQTGPPDMSVGDDLDLLNPRIMQREGLLDAYAVRDLPNGVGGIHSAIFTPNNDTLKNLDTLFISFDDTNVDLNVVTGTENRMILPHLFLI
jgi:hypothetical protein